MKNLKKKILVILALVLVAATLASCSFSVKSTSTVTETRTDENGNTTTTTTTTENDNGKVTTTTTTTTEGQAEPETVKHRFKVVNHLGFDLTKLYIAPAGVDLSAANEVLGEDGPLADSYSITFSLTGTDDNDNWNLGMVDTDGNSLECGIDLTRAENPHDAVITLYKNEEDGSYKINVR